MVNQKMLKSFVEAQIFYYRKAIKQPYNQPTKQAPEFINFLYGKLNAYQTVLSVINDKTSKKVIF